MNASPIPFPILLKQLTNPQSQTRLQALKNIMLQRSERDPVFYDRQQIFAALLTLLSDPDEQLRKAAITALGRLDDARAIPVLAQIMTHHPLARIRLRALKALTRLNRSWARPHILTMLCDPSALVRRTAVGIVGRWKDPRTVGSITALQGDANLNVRASVTRVLGQLSNIQQTVHPQYAKLGVAETYINSGNAHEALGLFDQAINDFTLAIQLEPDSTKAYLERGLTYTHMQRYEQALADFDRVLELEPGSMRVYFERGTTYTRMQRYEQALADFDYLLASDPKSVQIIQSLHNRGVTYLRLQAYEQAVADFGRLIELDPDNVEEYNAEGYNGRGCAYHFLEEYQLAVADYDHAIELDPTDALCYSNRGEAYQCLSKFDLAIADFEHALALNPGLPKTRDYLARARDGLQWSQIP